MDNTRLSCEQCGQFNECNYYEHRKAQSHICNNFYYNNDVIKALDKQVPKKPIDNFFDKRCPSCNSIWGITKNEKFCPNCGQAMDWDKSR